MKDPAFGARLTAAAAALALAGGLGAAAALATQSSVTAAAPVVSLSSLSKLAAANGSFDTFIKFGKPASAAGPTPAGESPSAKGAIGIQAFSWGVQNVQGIGTAGATPKATFSQFSIKKTVDSSSPALFQNAALGNRFSEVAVFLKKPASPNVYLTYIFSDVTVKAFSTSGDNQSVPSETVTFGFASVKVHYNTVNPDGSLGNGQTGGWNQVTNSTS